MPPIPIEKKIGYDWLLLPLQWSLRTTRFRVDRPDLDGRDSVAKVVDGLTGAVGTRAVADFLRGLGWPVRVYEEERSDWAAPDPFDLRVTRRDGKVFDCGVKTSQIGWPGIGIDQQIERADFKLFDAMNRGHELHQLVNSIEFSVHIPRRHTGQECCSRPGTGLKAAVARWDQADDVNRLADHDPEGDLRNALSELIRLLPLHTLDRYWLTVWARGPELVEEWKRAGRRVVTMGAKQLFKVPLAAGHSFAAVPEWSRCEGRGALETGNTGVARVPTDGMDDGVHGCG